MSVTINGIGFEHHHYDDRGDVLYLTVEGHEGPPARAYASPEGHNVEYNEDGRVVAMTLVNVRFLLDRDGALTVTIPPERVVAAQIEPLIAA